MERLRESDKGKTMSGDTSRSIGHQYALAMLDGGPEKVRSVALAAGSQLTMDAFLRVHDEEPVPAFLYSALCAMSLPTKRPKDDTLPIVREDGNSEAHTSAPKSLKRISYAAFC